MQVIPAINCQELACVKLRASQAGEIFDGPSVEEKWLHLDIADGSFTPGYATWRNTEDLKEIRLPADLNLEVHLMVKNPEEIFESWLKKGTKRIIIHLSTTENLRAITEHCNERQIPVLLAIEKEIEVEHAFPYIPLVFGCQILAVKPGLSGQKFDPEALNKIKKLRQRFPQLFIEVDGGVNPQVAKACRVAGASALVSASYIFDSSNPAQAFSALREI